MALHAVAPLHPAQQPTAPQPRSQPHLRPVDEPHVRKRRSPLALALIGVASVLGIITMQLWLSLATSAGAYHTDALIVQERELIRQERAMQQKVDMFASPQHLSQEASRLGMVQNARPAYLQLEGSVLVGDLTQKALTPRPNVISNAALAALMAPAAVASDATDEQKADQAGEGSEARTVGTPEPATPVGPVPWEGILSVPQTH